MARVSNSRLATSCALILPFPGCLVFPRINSSAGERSADMSIENRRISSELDFCRGGSASRKFPGEMRLSGFDAAPAAFSADGGGGELKRENAAAARYVSSIKPIWQGTLGIAFPYESAAAPRNCYGRNGSTAISRAATSTFDWKPRIDFRLKRR